MIEYAKDHAQMKYLIAKEKRFYKTASYNQIISKLGKKDQKRTVNAKLDAYYKF